MQRIFLSIAPSQGVCEHKKIGILLNLSLSFSFSFILRSYVLYYKGTAVVVISGDPGFNYRSVHNSQRYPNKFLWFITWMMFLSETMSKSDIFIRCVCRLGRDILH